MSPRPLAVITLLTICLCFPLPIFKAAAQQTNPQYLSQFPSVDKVMNAMRTSDPRETAIRQMGAFYQLVEIIKTLSGSREFRGFTPDGRAATPVELLSIQFGEQPRKRRYRFKTKRTRYR